MSKDGEYTCSFCMAKNTDPKVKCMVAGAGVAICDDCIEIAAGVVGDRLGLGEIRLTATDLCQLRRIMSDKAIALSVVLRNRQLIEENHRLRKENNDLQT